MGIYRKLRPHCRVVSKLADDYVLTSSSALASGGRVLERVDSVLHSPDTVRESLKGMKAYDFSIAVAVATGNVDNLKSCPLVPVSDFAAADKVAAVAASVEQPK